MSLQRKENNLRRAQARFDRVSRRSKQFQINFRREANSRGDVYKRQYGARSMKNGVRFISILPNRGFMWNEAA